MRDDRFSFGNFNWKLGERSKQTSSQIRQIVVRSPNQCFSNSIVCTVGLGVWAQYHPDVSVWDPGAFSSRPGCGSADPLPVARPRRDTDPGQEGLSRQQAQRDRGQPGSWGPADSWGQEIAGGGGGKGWGPAGSGDRGQPGEG